MNFSMAGSHFEYVRTFCHINKIFGHIIQHKTHLKGIEKKKLTHNHIIIISPFSKNVFYFDMKNR